MSSIVELSTLAMMSENRWVGSVPFRRIYKIVEILRARVLGFQQECLDLVQTTRQEDEHIKRYKAIRV